jgi:protein phosphatase
MGGHNAGEVASQVAVQNIDKFFTKEAFRKTKGIKEAIQHLLIKGFHHVNNSVIEMAQEDASRSGMGCTLVSCLIRSGLMHTCHVGDARCYVADHQHLEQITNDHSMIAAYEEKSKTDKNNESIKPPRQVITRAIGFPFTEDPEYHCREIQPGNRLLLCSDGLWSMVNDEQIHEVLMGAEAAEQATHTLVQMANEAGGTDNITAVVIFC